MASQSVHDPRVLRAVAHPVGAEGVHAEQAEHDAEHDGERPESFSVLHAEPPFDLLRLAGNTP